MNVKWDAMPDVDGYEESSISNVVLLPSKWKKDVTMSWRTDVDAEVDTGEESESETESKSESEEESEEEEEIGDDSEVG